MPLPNPIRTDRLEVRPFHEDDFERYLAFMTDPDATRHLLLEHEHTTPEGARELFELVRASYAGSEPVWALAIATDDDGYVGSCGMAPIDGPVWECYYTLLPAYRGRGYATEALRALVGFAFAELPIDEMRAYMSPENPDSAGVAERLGMTLEGMRTHPQFGNEAVLYRVSRSDWVGDGSID